MKSTKKNFQLLRSSFIIAVLSCLVIISGCKKEDPVDPYACSLEPGVLCDVAGIAGEIGGSGNGGHAQEAFLYWPMDVNLDENDHPIIVDFNNHCVRLINNENIIDRIIGSGMLGDDPAGDAAGINLNHPTDITIGPDGHFWLSSWHNWKIKKINKDTWEVTSPIGTNQGYSGDGGAASQAQFDLPSSVVFDPQGNIYISDQGNQCVRKVDTDMMVTTFVGGVKGYADGTGQDAMFSLPMGSNAVPGGKLAITNDGSSLLLADTENHRVRAIDLATAEVTTIAGTGAATYSGDGGAAVNAGLFYPTDVAVGPDDMIYIADSENNVIRRIDSNGTITTVAGTSEAGFSDNGTQALEARLHKPSGVFVTSDNVLFIADTYNQQIKKVKLP